MADTQKQTWICIVWNLQKLNSIFIQSSYFIKMILTDVNSFELFWYLFDGFRVYIEFEYMKFYVMSMFKTLRIQYCGSKKSIKFIGFLRCTDIRSFQQSLFRIEFQLYYSWKINCKKWIVYVLLTDNFLDVE